MKKLNKIIALALVFFSAWSFFFIFSSSLVLIDGQRYFALFDDAMISMRYAWNFSHGDGLVWNIGEKIEGYTNFLWVMIMSIFTYLVNDKIQAVIAFHVFVFFLTILNLFLYLKVYKNYKESSLIQVHEFVIISILILFYYPLTFWSLFGMEVSLIFTGLLSLFLLSEKHSFNKIQYLFIFIAFLFLLIRSDTLLYMIPFFIYRLVNYKSHFLIFAKEVLIIIILFLIYHAFRYDYYGYLFPNTYYLKMVGIPILFRLRDGIGYVYPYVLTTLPIIAFIIFSKFKFCKKTILFISLFLISIVYQIYVGGDPWDHWRQLCFTLPFILLIMFKNLFKSKSKTKIYLSSLIVFIILNWSFYEELFLIKPPLHTIENKLITNYVLAAKEVIEPSASLAFVSSGTPAYYSDFYIIDIFGKSDLHVARLKPDLSGSISWGRMRSVPGHNKYDLEYSLFSKNATFTQLLKLGNQDFNKGQHYVRIFYKGVPLWLQKDSPLVRWELLENQE